MVAEPSATPVPGYVLVPEIVLTLAQPLKASEESKERAPMFTLWLLSVPANPTYSVPPAYEMPGRASEDWPSVKAAAGDTPAAATTSVSAATAAALRRPRRVRQGAPA